MATLVDNWRKEHVPEIGRRSAELDRHQRTFRAELRRSRNDGVNGFLRGDIFNGDLGPLSKRFRQNNQRTSSADGMGRAFECGSGLSGNTDANWNTQEHALRAAALSEVSGRVSPGFTEVAP